MVRRSLNRRNGGKRRRSMRGGMEATSDDPHSEPLPKRPPFRRGTDIGLPDDDDDDDVTQAKIREWIEELDFGEDGIPEYYNTDAIDDGVKRILKEKKNELDIELAKSDEEVNIKYLNIIKRNIEDILRPIAEKKHNSKFKEANKERTATKTIRAESGAAESGAAESSTAESRTAESRHQPRYLGWKHPLLTNFRRIIPNMNRRVGGKSKGRRSRKRVARKAQKKTRRRRRRGKKSKKH